MGYLHSEAACFSIMSNIRLLVIMMSIAKRQRKKVFQCVALASNKAKNSTCNTSLSAQN